MNVLYPARPHLAGYLVVPVVLAIGITSWLIDLPLWVVGVQALLLAAQCWWFFGPPSRRTPTRN